jgi:hypothetical protein
MASFDREVDEAVRQDRAKLLWQRYGRLALAVALIIIGGTAGYVWWQDYRAGQQQQATAALAAALSRGDSSAIEAADSLETVANTAQGDIAMLARLYEAALLIDADDREAAVTIYRQVAEDAGTPPLWRDYAQLMSVLHQVDRGEPADLQARLAPLTGPDNPWRFTARELSGLLAVRQGDDARAAEIFAALADSTEAPAGVRQRARDLAAWLASE